MKKIKTLTVGGETYQITDPEAARIRDDLVGEQTWSSQNIVDRLCPAFSESGSLVTCEPVEGYPLTVTAQEEATVITRCGKNLLPEDWKDWNNWTNNRFMLHLPPGQYAVWGTKTDSAYLYLTKSTDGGNTWANAGATANGTFEGYIITNTRDNTILFTVAEGELWALWASPTYFSGIEKVQIEMGRAKTEYEDSLVETFAPGEPVPALDGTNTLWADTGSITVTGRADPVAIIEKLQNAILSLGGNV